jgi:hypothetical protein
VMLRHFDWSVVTEVSKECSASIVMVEQAKKSVLPDPESGGTELCSKFIESD